MIIIDLPYLYQILLPIDLRTPITNVLLNTVRLTFQGLYNSFYETFNITKYNLTFNGQVCMLEHLLNDKYDTTLRRIEIIQDQAGKSTYLFNKIEQNESTYLFSKVENGHNTFIYNKSEVIGLNDFIIQIPSDVVFGEIQLRKLVDKYKLPDKSYSIEII